MGDVSNPYGHILFDAVWSPEHFDTFFYWNRPKNETKVGQKNDSDKGGLWGVVEIAFWVTYFVLHPIWLILVLTLSTLGKCDPWSIKFSFFDGKVISHK